LRRIAAACLALLAAPVLRAEWPDGWRRERVQSLFLAETPFVAGEEDIRLSGAFARSRAGTGRATEWTLTADYGAMERLQGRVRIPYKTLRLSGGGRSSGLSDPSLEALYDVSPVTSDAVLATYAGLTLATGDEKKGLGREESVLAAGLRFSHQVRPPVEFHGNLGMEWDEEGPHVVGHAAAVFQADRWFPVLEVNGIGAAADRKFVTPGVIYRTWGDVEWGLAFPLSVGKGAPQDGVLLRVTRVFGGREP
jgi:hypothetical protein